MNLLSILLDAPAATSGSGMQGMSGIVMIMLIFVIFYFFMIRPQSKRQKEIQKQRAAMKPGDKVITSGGIYGKIRSVKEDNSVVIEIADNVRIKVDKGSVFLSAQDAQDANVSAK